MHDLERARRLHPVSALLAALVLASPSFAQSLPPETHDPEPVGAATRGPEGGSEALRDLAGRRDPDAAEDLSRFLAESQEPLLRAQAWGPRPDQTAADAHDTH